MILHNQALIDEYTGKGWWRRQTFIDLFLQQLTAHPDEIALLDPPNRADFTSGASQHLTYRDIARRVDALAGRLVTLGAGGDDIAVIQLPNIVELVIALLACARIGIIASPVAVGYRQYELSNILSIARPRFFITIDRFKEQQLAATAHTLIGQSSQVHVLSWGEVGAPIHALDDLPPAAATALADYLDTCQLTANDIITAAWTSGTTAEPKAVLRSHNNWYVSSRAVIEAARLVEGDILLCPLPMINMGAISGFLVPWLELRSTLVLHHPFDLAVYLRQLEDERVAYTIAPPAILNALLKNKAQLDAIDLRCLRAVASGAAPLSPWMVKTYQEDYAIDVINFFGSNEGIALASSRHDVPDPAHRADYFPRWGVEGIDWPASLSRMNATKLVDMATGEIITEAGQPGELMIRGPGVFPAYLNRPALTRAAFDAAGFHRTGDVFMIAGEGELSRFYRFIDRCKDIIIRGGMNISPSELDALLAGHPLLTEAAVAAYPDADLGERVAVFAVARSAEAPTLEDIVSYLKAKQIAVFKLPERLVLLESLPRNAMNKVLRRELVRFIDQT